MGEPSLLDEATKLAAAGGGAGGGFFALRWVVQWVTGRLDKRQERLDAEHAALDMSWRDYRKDLERRLRALERANEALRLSLQHATAALIRVDPANDSLAIITKIMSEAFPADFSFAAARAGAALDAADQEMQQ